MNKKTKKKKTKLILECENEEDLQLLYDGIMYMLQTGKIGVKDMVGVSIE